MSLDEFFDRRLDGPYVPNYKIKERTPIEKMYDIPQPPWYKVIRNLEKRTYWHLEQGHYTEAKQTQFQVDNLKYNIQHSNRNLKYFRKEWNI
jgi:hypothetical protein